MKYLITILLTVCGTCGVILTTLETESAEITYASHGIGALCKQFEQNLIREHADHLTDLQNGVISTPGESAQRRSMRIARAYIEAAEKLAEYEAAQLKGEWSSAKESELMKMYLPSEKGEE